MKRCLVIRWGAYGDILIALPLLEELKRRSEYLHLETGSRGAELLREHRAIHKITTFDITKYPKEMWDRVAEVRWRTLSEAGSWDFMVNLWRTLETECIAEEYQESFFWPREVRRKHYGAKIFAEAPFARAGIPLPEPFRLGTIFFPPAVAQWMPYWKKEHKDHFNVAIVVSGSTCQKIPVGMKELARRIIDEYPEARIFLLGAKESGWMGFPLDIADKLQFDFGMKNVARLVGKTPYMQSLAIVKMADYVIGPISSLMHGAGLFGTPKTTICTDCSVEQATKYHKNDFSIQADVPCCPCHRAIYNAKYCLIQKTELGEIPACNIYWDTERIMQGLAFAYKIKKQRAEVERIEGDHFSSLPDFVSGDMAVPPPYGRFEFARVAELLKGRKGLNLVEIGMTRNPRGMFGDGFSTPYFAYLAKKNGHRFYSVDINPETVERASKILDAYGVNGDHVKLLATDGLKFLREWKDGGIDFLYLDGWDYGPDDLKLQQIKFSEDRHREAAVIGAAKMSRGGLILIDDMIDGRWLGGKGRKAVPYLVENDWEVILPGWAFLLKKKESAR